MYGFQADTLVLTNNGNKPIQDIKKGDFVLTHKSRYKMVKDVQMINNSNVYFLQSYGAHKIIAGPNTLFYTKPKKKRNIFKPASWTEVKNVYKGMFMCSSYNTESVNSYYKQSLMDNDLKFYEFLGAYFANGLLSEYKRTDKNYYDRKIIIYNNIANEKIMDRIFKNIEFHYFKRYNKQSISYIINNKSLFTYLYEFGKGSENKHFTDKIFNLTKNQKHAILKGYFKVNGIYDKESDSYIVSSVSNKLIYDLKQLVMEIYRLPVKVYKDATDKKIILGQTINTEPRYILRYKNNISMYDHAVVYNSHEYWQPLRKVFCLEKQKQTLYNLIIDEDMSYTANSLMVSSGYN